MGYVMTAETSLDIDDPNDFWLAEQILRKRTPVSLRKTVARLPLVGSALVDLARGLRDPATERLVQADFRRRSISSPGCARRCRRSAPTARRLLIVSLSDMVYQLKLEAMLGAGLKLQGWRPIVLTNSPTNTQGEALFPGLRDRRFRLSRRLPADRRRSATSPTAAHKAVS